MCHVKFLLFFFLNTQSWSLNGHLLFLMAFTAANAKWCKLDFVLYLLMVLNKSAIFSVIPKDNKCVYILRANFYDNIEKLLCFTDY